MKRILQAVGLLTVLMVMNVITFLIMFGTPQSRAQEPETVALLPGDIDCDGSVNLADCMNLLAYLFSDGEPPSVCAQTTDPPATLTKQDLVEALVEARNVFEPRLQDYVREFFEITDTSTDCVDGELLIDVPDDQIFFIESFARGNSGNNSITACILRDDGTTDTIIPGWSLFSPLEDIVLFPGDQLYARVTSGSLQMLMQGYWAAYQEETE